jgi:hypothetical protein
MTDATLAGRLPTRCGLTESFFSDVPLLPGDHVVLCHTVVTRFTVPDGVDAERTSHEVAEFIRADLASDEDGVSVIAQTISTTVFRG